jgi:glycosyltransferase involved in cell wall biosynthesis
MLINCSIGIMAHNEEANIGPLLEAMLSQRLKTVAITEIVVVASGCTDTTEAIVLDWVRQDPRIRLLVQEKRSGKAVAINEYLPLAKEKVVVLCSADLLPELDSIEQLVSPLGDPEVGVTSSRPVPVMTLNSLWASLHTCCGNCTTRST